MSLGCSCGWIQPHSFWVQLPTTWPVCSAYCSPCIRKGLWEAATAKKISRALSSVSSGILTTLMSVKKVCLPGPGPQSYDSFHFIMYLLLFYASKCGMSFKKKQQLQQLQSCTIYWAGYMALLVINKRTWRCFKCALPISLSAAWLRLWHSWLVLQVILCIYLASVMAMTNRNSLTVCLQNAWCLCAQQLSSKANSRQSFV